MKKIISLSIVAIALFVGLVAGVHAQTATPITTLTPTTSTTVTPTTTTTTTPAMTVTPTPTGSVQGASTSVTVPSGAPATGFGN